MPALLSSRQRLGKPVRVLAHPIPEFPLQVVLLLTAAALATVGWRRGPRRAALLLGSVLLFFVANALICSFGADAFDRYQGRVAWLLPYCVALAAWWLARNGETLSGGNTRRAIDTVSR